MIVERWVVHGSWLVFVDQRMRGYSHFPSRSCMVILFLRHAILEERKETNVAGID